MTQQQVARFGPARSRDRVGVPSDHFTPADQPVKARHRKALKALKREQRRRETTHA